MSRLADATLLPAELVAVILHAALFEDGKALDGEGRRHFLNYRRVCKAWRQTAFSTPDLWRSLEINVSKDFGDDKAVAKAEMAATMDGWFGRKGEGVGLQLAFTEVACGQRVVSVPEIMRYLGGTGFRFKTLQFKHFELYTPEDVDVVVKRRPATKAIKHLTLTGDEHTHPGHNFLSTLQHAFPQLETIILDNLWPQLSRHERLQIQRVPLQHNDLQSLTLAYIGLRIEGLMSALAGVPRLQELVIRNCSWGVSSTVYRHRGPDSASTPKFKVQHVPSIRRFIVVESLDRDILQALALPSLIYFQIVGDLFHPWAVAPANQIIEQLGFFIEVTKTQDLILDLSLARTTPGILGMLLKRLPMIRRLGLQSPISLPENVDTENVHSSVKEVVFRQWPAGGSDKWIPTLMRHFARGDCVTAIYLPGKGLSDEPGSWRPLNGLLGGSVMQEGEDDGEALPRGPSIRRTSQEMVDVMLRDEHDVLCHEYATILRPYIRRSV